MQNCKKKKKLYFQSSPSRDNVNLKDNKIQTVKQALKVSHYIRMFAASGITQ